jgi:hypothetical protein
MKHRPFYGAGTLTLEPDGTATGCNPVEVGSIPTGVSYGPGDDCADAQPLGSISRLVGAARPAAHSVPHPRLGGVCSAYGF